MPPSLASDRIKLNKLGEKNSPATPHHQKAAFRIAKALCDAFVPKPGNPRKFSISIGHCYVLIESASGVSLSNTQFNGGEPFYKLENGTIFPLNAMLSVEATEGMGKEIANGWFREVMRALECNQGVDAAVGLSEVLHLYYHLRAKNISTG